MGWLDRAKWYDMLMMSEIRSFIARLLSADKPPPSNHGRLYEAPTTLAGARAALSRPGAIAIAGGQSILPALAARAQRSGTLVDLLKIPELQVISVERDAVRVGASVMLTEFLRPPLVDALPGVAAAVDCVGNHVVRNRASFGGCLAWADPCGEIPMILMAYGATIVTTRRKIAADDFVAGANKNILSPGEFIVEVRIPRTVEVMFEEQLARRSAGRAVLSTACSRTKGQDDIRITVGGLVDRPVRSAGIRAASRDQVLAAANDFLDGMLNRFPAHRDTTTVEYRRKIAVPLIGRCLDRMELR